MQATSGRCPERVRHGRGSRSTDSGATCKTWLALGDLQSKKVDLYLHQQALDTSTPSGKAMFGMLGVFAEFERTIIQERVKAGLARARAKGTTLGRPKTNAKIEQQIRNLAAKGVGKVKIARMLGIGVSVTQRVLA
jgi:DNA invertase Pin-like site-specific DNA recombinase